MARLTASEREEVLAGLTDKEAEAILYDWRGFNARPDQTSPDGDWDIWLVLAGRGWGKTRTGAEWVREQVTAGARRIALVAETQKDLEEVMIEGDSGLLSVFPKGERPEYRKKPVQLTFPNGAVALGYNATQPDQLRGPQFDTAWCFIAGTMVSTATGDVPIESIKAGDEVLTRKGPRKVLRVKTRTKEAGIVTFSTGRELVGTADHNVYTLNGWTRLDSLTRENTLCAINASSGAGSAGTATTGTITNGHKRSLFALACGFTALSMQSIMAACRTAWTCITSTATSWTTGLKTLQLSIDRNIWRFIEKPILSHGWTGAKRSGLLSSAQNAARDYIAVDEGQRFASPASSSALTQPERKSGNAAIAAQSSRQSPETFAASVVSTWRPMGERDVYCLTVEGQPEFFANGILVHNCDEMAKWRYARETWDQLQFGMRLGQHPRQVITTTPRPIELLKAIVAGDEGKVAVTKGRTMDNAANLAAPFLEKIRKRYEGTRLGRQELNAEILGDLPGALWSMGQIDSFRIQEQPEDMGRILVAVDPAVTATEESDEHGIIVGGISGQEGILLHDGSLRGSPLDWARRALALYDSYAADGIVVEVNQGGDMVASTLRSVRANIKIIEVRATRGKHIRAEHIASLYEQGRIRHVGGFPELETQMTQMTSHGYEGAGSPDRLDAMVWLWTEMFPDMVRPVVDVSRFKISAGGGWLGA